MVVIEVKKNQARFLFQNMFGHDAVHDFNSNHARIAKLEHLIIKFAGYPVDDIKFNNDVPEFDANKRVLIQGGVKDDEYLDNLIKNFDTFGNYEYFYELDSFPTILYYTNIHHTETSDKIKKIVDFYTTNITDVLRFTGAPLKIHSIPLQAEGDKNLIMIIQLCIELIDSIRLDVLGQLKNTRRVSGGADPNIVPKSVINIKPIEHIIEKTSNSSPSFKSSSVPSLIYQLTDKLLGSPIEREINHIFTSPIQNEKLKSFYNVFKNALLYYHKSIDNTLPIYSIINSYFIEDTLLLYMMNLFIPSPFTITEFSKLFDEIIKIRINPILSEPQIERRGGKIERGGKRMQGGDLKDIMNIIATIPIIEKIITNKYNTYEKILQASITNIETFLKIELDYIKVDIQNVESHRVTDHNEIFTKLYHLLDHLLKKDEKYILNEIENVQSNITENPRKAKRSEAVFHKKIINIFENLITILKKEYIVKNIETRFVGVPQTQSQALPKHLSVGSKYVVNQILKILTTKIINVTKAPFTFGLGDGFNSLYNLEEQLLLKTSERGVLPAQFDAKLLQQFWINVQPKDVIEIIRSEAKNKLKNSFNNRPIHLINNALTTTIDDRGLRIVDDLITDTGSYKLSCPFASILDAQGSFGSCRTGISSPDYITGHQDITIQTPEKDFEFNIEISVNASSVNASGKFAVNYYCIYEKLTISDCNITGIVTKSALNILSANNTFTKLLNHIDVKFTQNGGAINWELFDSEYEQIEIIRILSRKLIGDLSQELTAVAQNGGYNTPPENYNGTSRLLLNGDQPSTVRAAFLALVGTGDVEPDVGVFFVSSGTTPGLLFKKDVSLATAVAGPVVVKVKKKATKRGGKTRRKSSKQNKKTRTKRRNH